MAKEIVTDEYACYDNKIAICHITWSILEKKHKTSCFGKWLAVNMRVLHLVGAYNGIIAVITLCFMLKFMTRVQEYN